MGLVTTRTMNYTYGRGETHFAAFKPGTYDPAGFRYIGNTPAFGFTNQVQELDHNGSDHGVGELDFSIPTSVTRSGTLTTDDISLENLALSFFGAKATVTQTAATGQSETFTGTVPGLSYQLGYTTAKPMGIRNVTNVAVTVGAAAKVAGTDYQVDLARGLVQILPGGTIAAGASITVTYDTVSSSFDQVLSGSTPVEGAIMFIADNPAGKNIDVLLPWVRLTPNGEFALKAENALQQLQFNMKVLKVAGRSAAYLNGQPYTGA